MKDQPTADQLIASAAKFLIEGGEEDAASILLACDFHVRVWEAEYDESPELWFVDLTGPRVAYDCLSDRDHEIHEQVRNALEAVVPASGVFDGFSIKAGVVRDLAPDWHAEMIERARGKTVDNQAVRGDGFRLWQNLRFRSATEVKIAEALDRARVLFLPLCMARLNGPQGRVNREPDFLVCKDGKWGILEVDGEPYHPPQRTVHDHERDRLFQRHGIRVAQHYDSTDCYVTPDKVVAEFLALLDRAY